LRHPPRRADYDLGAPLSLGAYLIEAAKIGHRAAWAEVKAPIGIVDEEPALHASLLLKATHGKSST
jgi:hypothetical protein